VIEQLGHETDHPPPSSIEVKHVWSYTSNFHALVLSAVLVLIYQLGRCEEELFLQ